MRSGISIIILTTLALCAPALAYDWSTNPGKGWRADPYQIWEPNQLMAIGSNPELMDKTYILTGDIVFDPNNNPAHVFTAALIGAGTEFMGRFDGNGYRIVNLTIDGASSAGLFDTLSLSDLFFESYVRNVTLENVNISGGFDVGAICGVNDGGVLDNCTVSGTVSGNTRVGGLCGLNDYGTIQNCSSRCTVSGFFEVGGFCGRNRGEYSREGISNCVADNTVVNSDGVRVGGFCGYNNGIITICYANASITGFGDEKGGFCGYNSGRITICYALSTITGYGSEVGGFCGLNDDRYHGYNLISRCYAAGDVKGHGIVGGFCGENIGTINRSYAAGSVAGYFDTGGFCGRNRGELISECYSSGTLIRNDPSLGGFVGDNEAPLENCFWDTQASGRTNGVGNGDPDPSGITGLTTSQMQQQSTFADAGWDFVGETVNGTEEIWYMQGYPALQWKPRIMGNGDGSKQNPYVIEDSVDFEAFCWDTKYWGTGVYTRLDCDLDLRFIDKLPLFRYPDPINPRRDLYVTYRGHFDGNHHVLRNLTLNQEINDGELSINPNGQASGLFYIIQGGTVVNLGIRDVDITNTYWASAPLCNINDGGTIKNCYCIGGSVNAVSASGFCVTNKGTIMNSFSTVQVTGTMNTAGFCLTGNNGTISDCFWDIQTSGQGSEGDDNYGATGKTTQQMQTLSTFTDAGWDFVGHIVEKGTWRMCADGVDYPRLSGEFSRGGDLACPDGVGIEDLEALSMCWLKDVNLVTELNDDSDTIVGLAELARVSQYWTSNWRPWTSSCGDCGGVDFNGDGYVMMEDLEMIINDWLRVVYPECSACDANGDERIDLNDLAVLSENWP